MHIAGPPTIACGVAEAVTTLTLRMLEEIDAALADFAQRGDVSVVVLSGAGPAFCAGGDIKAVTTPSFTREDSKHLNALVRQVPHRLETKPQPAIAKAHGICLTGGLELALACDLMLGADETTLGDTHAELDLHPSWGQSARLPRRIGDMRARELCTPRGVSTGARPPRSAWPCARSRPPNSTARPMPWRPPSRATARARWPPTSSSTARPRTSASMGAGLRARDALQHRRRQAASPAFARAPDEQDELTT